MQRPSILALCALLFAGTCGPAAETTQPPPAPAPTVGALDPTLPEATRPTAPPKSAGDDSVYLWAAGDIASCTTEGDTRLARLLRDRRGRIALLGDIAYPDGTREQFAKCFDPDWGPLRPRLRPTPGNHEYRTAGADPYFDYFGEQAAQPGRGWYAYNLGDHWRALVLNSNCASVGGCGATSPQGQWLRRQLDRHADRHIVAYWHVPRFSSGRHGSNQSMNQLWRTLYRGGADIVLNGHDHTYERFAPQNPDAEPRARGIRQFVVGTGGYVHYPFEQPPLPLTEVRNDDTFGALRLRLDPDGYRWRFVPSEGAFTDSGRHQFP